MLLVRKGKTLDSFAKLTTRHVGLTLHFLTLLMLLWGGIEVEAASNPRLTSPASHLGPSADSPIFLAVHGQIGGAFEFDSGVFGYGTELVFRPGAAANFLSFLYNWNAGICLQVDYLNVSDNESILSGDFIVRRYLQPMRDPGNRDSTFFGAGFGASRVILPPGSSGAQNKYWSLLVEAGREWTVKDKYLMWLKAQYRHYDHSGYNYSNWTLQVGAGIPLPW